MKLHSIIQNPKITFTRIFVLTLLFMIFLMCSTPAHQKAVASEQKNTQSSKKSFDYINSQYQIASLFALPSADSIFSQYQPSDGISQFIDVKENRRNRESISNEAGQPAQVGSVSFCDVPTVLPRQTPLLNYSPALCFQYSGLEPGTYTLRVWLLETGNFLCASGQWCERTFTIDNSTGTNSAGNIVVVGGTWMFLITRVFYG